MLIRLEYSKAANAKLVYEPVQNFIWIYSFKFFFR